MTRIGRSEPSTLSCSATMSGICERPRVRSEIFCSTPSAGLSTPLRMTRSGVIQRPSTVVSKSEARSAATWVRLSLAALFSSSRAMRTRFWPTSASGAVAISVAKRKNLARSGKRMRRRYSRAWARTSAVSLGDAAGEAGGVAGLDADGVVAGRGVAVAGDGVGGGGAVAEVPGDAHALAVRVGGGAGVEEERVVGGADRRVAVGAGVDGRRGVDQHVGGVAAHGAGRAAVVGDGQLDRVRAGRGEAALDLRAFEDDAVAEAPAPAGQRAVAVGGERRRRRRPVSPGQTMRSGPASAVGAWLTRT